MSHRQSIFGISVALLIGVGFTSATLAQSDQRGQRYLTVKTSTIKQSKHF